MLGLLSAKGCCWIYTKLHDNLNCSAITTFLQREPRLLFYLFSHCISHTEFSSLSQLLDMIASP
jgi:hypothetical protein